MTNGRRRHRGWIAAWSLVMCLLAGCPRTEHVDRPDDFATSTTDAKGPFSTLGERPPAPTSQEIATKLDSAIAARNFCDVAIVLEALQPIDNTELTAMYRVLGDRIPTISGFVPAEITASWNVLSSTLAELNNVGDKAGVELNPSLVHAALSARAPDEAAAAIFSWRMQSCPEPTTTSTSGGAQK